jgi:tetratricopeptide (TPR) repeat protein
MLLHQTNQQTPHPQRRVKALFIFLLLFFIPIVSFSNDIRTLYESAVEAYNKGEFDNAINLYHEIIKIAPQFSPAYIGVGLALRSKGGDIEEVLYYYKTAVDKDPASVAALEQLGRLYYSMGQIEKAKGVFEKILKLNPNMPSVKQTLGWIYLAGKNANPAKAALYFKDVLKTHKDPEVYFGLGVSYFASNQREKALDIITQLRNMGQNDYADRLETSVRENRRVLTELDAPPPEAKDFEKTADGPKGLKVRLRGKLDEL